MDWDSGPGSSSYNMTEKIEISNIFCEISISYLVELEHVQILYQFFAIINKINEKSARKTLDQDLKSRIQIRIKIKP